MATFAATPKPTLSEEQIKVLFAIIDTFIPELEGEELESFVRENSNGTNDDALRAFGRAGVMNTKVSEIILAKLHSLPAEKIEDLGKVFKVLSTKIGTLALGGTYGEFYSLSREQRAEIVLSWSNSMITKLRIFARAMLALASMSFYTQPLDVVYKAIEYPGPDPEMHSERFSAKTFPSYDFIKVPAEGVELTFDVVIVGSGAGGGVMAAELSAAGKRVLVIEKGHHYGQHELTLNQCDGLTNLYESSGSLTTTDGALTVLAGATWGGGTTVNWCASLQLPYFVREEWAKQGLPYFNTPAYQKSIDAVIARLGISDQYLKHNTPNRLLLEACHKLGYPYKNIPQNTAHQEHSCGWCGFGCRFGEKQGTMMTFLQDAKDHGAQFMQDSFVEKVLVQKGRAVGVVGYQNGGGRFAIKANKVVVSAGSIHTPALLQRSGLKNKNIGKNLHLHPVTYVFGKFDEKIDCYQGSIMTALTTVAENTDGNGYGSKIEVPSHHPGLNAAFIKFKDAKEHKRQMLEINHLMPLIVLTRDRDGGSITLGPDGLPRINYVVSKHDTLSLEDGVERCLRILIAAGAKTIYTTQRGVEEFHVNKELGAEDPAFKTFLDNVKKTSIKPGSALIGSAHQMGSCRMGSNPKTSAVKPTGETWEVKDLYVADASTFPTASGVNPMLTTYSMSHSIAQFIKRADNAAKL
ncbi:long-chain-alcohol oxidase [Entomortierella parvispora]|uniref:Long-chain-alcohol oxidase n=1 Tax=Entomortierella parvispora TaxID=205924 RepID=A0A9P3LVQ5_9FUNG|nr:long-chain-alcohol oxidase [Entomortierella parvispora]